MAIVKSLTKISKTDIYRYLKVKDWFNGLERTERKFVFQIARTQYKIDVGDYGQVIALKRFHYGFKNNPMA